MVSLFLSVTTHRSDNVPMLVALEDGLLVVRIKFSVPHSSVATEFVLVVAELQVGEIVRRDMSPPWFFLTWEALLLGCTDVVWSTVLSVSRRVEGGGEDGDAVVPAFERRPRVEAMRLKPFNPEEYKGFFIRARTSVGAKQPTV